MQSIPTTWIGLEKWLQELWRSKDQLLENVYEKRWKFPALNSRQHLPQPVLPTQYLSLVAFLAFIWWSLQQTLLTFQLNVWLWILASSGLMVAVSRYTKGLQDIEVALESNGLFCSLKALLQRRSKDQGEDSKED